MATSAFCACSSCSSCDEVPSLDLNLLGCLSDGDGDVSFAHARSPLTQTRCHELVSCYLQYRSL